MFSRIFKILFLFVFCGGVLFGSALIVQAQNCDCEAVLSKLEHDESGAFSDEEINCIKTCQSVMGGVGDACRETGDCKLNDFILVMTGGARIILGLVGALALLVFVYAGVKFLISAGNSETVTKARGLMIGAVIGLLIVFLSYAIIQFTLSTLGITGAKDGAWATSEWFK